MRQKIVSACMASAALVIGFMPVQGDASDQNHRVPRAIAPSTLPAIGRVDERFLSYNVESVEVTGGNFWAPYPKPGQTAAPRAVGPHGTEFATDAYQKRDPIDLRGNQRLRMLTKALGPAWMRVSGSWANSIFFQDDDKPAMPAPKGYQGVLTRAQWAGAVEFAKAVDAKILTSFATSEGARGPDGTWNPDTARRLFDYTRVLGSRIDAVELMNEPNVSRAPYAPAAFARDHKALADLVANVSPQTLVAGPSATGEAGFKLFANPPEQMSTARLLSGKPAPRFDVFSHHFYGAVSQRCKSLGERNGTNVNTSYDEALSEGWLARADQAQAFYRAMRDRYAPGAPIWITEMAQTACGGDPWSSTFRDTFRFVDQLGRLARQDVSIVFHNTLAASDYALIDDVTWQPRPNYWAALLWRRSMGQTVLDSGINRDGLHVYAHCQRGKPGGVALVAVNLSEASTAALQLPATAWGQTLTSGDAEGKTVKLNGKPLALTAKDQLPKLSYAAFGKGKVTLPAASVTFVTIPDARNPNCR